MKDSHKTFKGTRRQSSNLWLGVIFIVGGIVALVNQLGILPFELDWWALFIMLPAVVFLNQAYNRFRANEI